MTAGNQLGGAEHMSIQNRHGSIQPPVNLESGRRVCVDCASRQTGLCSVIDPAQLSQLRQHGRIVTLTAGQELLGQEEVGTVAGSMRSGILKLSRVQRNGTEFVTQLFFPGDLILLSEKSTEGFAVEAASKGEICLIDYNDLLEIVLSCDRTRQKAVKLIAEELEVCQDWVVKMGVSPVAERLAFLLLGLAERSVAHGQVPDAFGEITLSLPVSRKNIAAFLGTTIESLSRQMHALARSGTIRIGRGRQLSVRSMEKLRRAAQS